MNDYFTLFYVKHFELPMCMKCAIQINLPCLALIYPLSSSCSLDKAKLLSACGGIYTAVTTVDENSRGR